MKKEKKAMSDDDEEKVKNKVMGKKRMKRGMKTTMEMKGKKMYMTMSKRRWKTRDKQKQR